MKKIFNLTFLAGLWLALHFSATAQTAVPPPTPDYQALSDQQLDQLLGPIALYPDPLIAQILPAATLPPQIVLADRYVAGGGDPNQIEQQPWDASVQALAHYPSVLKWMDDNLNWTTELGQAFLNQQSDVMNSIQRLRAAAQKVGNLQSTPQQQVISDGGQIEIVPADPQVIYVPIYDPDAAFYQTAYGPPFITFGAGFAMGGWLDCDFDWGNHNLIVWDHAHPRPVNWWRYSHSNHGTIPPAHTTVWHPVNRPVFVGSNRGDRGWANNPSVRQPTAINTPTIFRGSNIHPVNPPNRDIAPAIHAHVPARTDSTPAQHFAPMNNPPNNGAFIGIQSSRDTQTFSDRGQESRETITHSETISHPAPAPAPRPAPSFSGGGGGSHHR